MFITPKHTARDLLHKELRILINEIFLIQNSKYINRNLRRISPYLNLLLQVIFLPGPKLLLSVLSVLRHLQNPSEYLSRLLPGSGP